MADIRDFFKSESVQTIELFPAGNYVEVDNNGEKQLWLLGQESDPEDWANSRYYTEEKINKVTDKLIVI